MEDFTFFVCVAFLCIAYLFLLFLLKKIGSARLRESDLHPISPKTPAPQYQPIDRKKRKGKRAEDYSSLVGIEQLRPIKKTFALLLKPASPTPSNIGVSKIVPEGHLQVNKSPAVLRGSAARLCISVPMCDQSTACNPH